MTESVGGAASILCHLSHDEQPFTRGGSGTIFIFHFIAGVALLLLTVVPTETGPTLFHTPSFTMNFFMNYS